MGRRFRITVRGTMSERFCSGFPGVTGHRAPEGTVLLGDLDGDEELAALLARLENLGVEVVEVHAVVDTGRS